MLLFGARARAQGVFFLGKAVDVARRAGDVSREAEATSLLGESLATPCSRVCFSRSPCACRLVHRRLVHAAAAACVHTRPLSFVIAISNLKLDTTMPASIAIATRQAETEHTQEPARALVGGGRHGLWRGCCLGEAADSAARGRDGGGGRGGSGVGGWAEEGHTLETVRWVAS